MLRERARIRFYGLVTMLVLVTIALTGNPHQAAARLKGSGAAAAAGARCAAQAAECRQTGLCISANRSMAESCQNRCNAMLDSCTRRSEQALKAPPKRGTRVPTARPGRTVIDSVSPSSQRARSFRMPTGGGTAKKN